MSNRFFTPKKCTQLCTALIWAGALIALLTNTVDRKFFWIGLAVSLVGLILRLTIVRCPTCRKRLTDMQSVPDRCPYCGEKLD